MIYNPSMNIRVKLDARRGMAGLLMVLLCAVVCVVLTVLPIIHDYPPIPRPDVRSVPVEQRAAVVLGAKTKDNVISNVLRARVDYAIELYQSGQVGALIFTGGFRDKDPAREQSEAEVARTYARARGVPNERIWTESVSTTTLENLREARTIIREQGFTEVALVSDRWHLARAQVMARDLGLVVEPAPTPYSVYRSRWRQVQFIGREIWARWAYVLFEI